MTQTSGSSPQPNRLLVRDIVEIENRYYILASSSLAAEVDRVLKHGETFAVFDRYGDIKPVGVGEHGLYHEGTRFLSTLLLGFAEDRPLLLSSNVKEDNSLIAVDLTNPDMVNEGIVTTPRGSVHLSRTKVLWDGTCHERFTLRNYGLTQVSVPMVLRFDADYADIFEVRGTHRARRGARLETRVDKTSVVLSYEGLDGVVRATRLLFDPAPVALSETEARFHVVLEAGEQVVLDVAVVCESHRTPAMLTFRQARDAAQSLLAQGRSQGADVFTSNEQFNDWLNRSVADLSMMTSDTPVGPYPYAGVPWFNTPFGRDGIITALECLWINPTMARGVLSFLASHQASETNEARDAQPGKILHEARMGEMAALGEIPFGRYYGSHDATPLFVLLAARYYERTAEREFITTLWPAIERALAWIDRYGDLDGDGFAEYYRRSPYGLVHQGWKDSHDAVFHADGRLAEGPIALCEVQGYIYAARQGAADLAAALGHTTQAETLRRQADVLRERFEEAFWSDELGTYGLALDGAKQLCRIRTSNPGHCLFTGIASQERAERVAHLLVDERMFSGWGVRTVAAGELRYNPMAYHNGSVWPHDNALIAQGLARYGLRDAALHVLQGMFDASIFVDLHRLPELFCGFGRRPGEGPTLYPVACSPQSWAAGAVFLLLQAILGLEVSATRREVRFSHARLPPFLEDVRIRGLRVGTATLDLQLQRHEANVALKVVRRDGPVEILSVK
jgi:glycogen debranching enzyme